MPDAVINKPGRLTDEEFEKIKTHPGRGAKILQNIEEMPKLAIGARWHHERYDGKGYPEGISGDEIPEEARIIAVADAYDAMTSNRSYRKFMSQFGVGYVVTEMISDMGLIYGNKETLSYLNFEKSGLPTCVQLFGSSPETMAKAVLTIYG